MKRFLPLLALCLVSAAYAQTPGYPVAPTSSTTKTVGQNLTVNFNAVTENTDGSAVTGTIYYEVFESAGPGIPFTVVANAANSGPPLSVPLTVAGTPCFYVVAVEGGTFLSGAVTGGVASAPSAILCAAVNAPVSTETPNKPTGVVIY